MRHVEGAHHEPDSPAGAHDAHRLGDRPVRVALFEHRHRIGAAERGVVERQRLGIALGEMDYLGQPVRFRQLRGFVQQKRVDIHCRNRIGRTDAPRQQADERSGAAADLEDRFPGLRGHHVEQSPEHRTISRHPRTVFERGDAAQIRAPDGHHREMLHEERDRRVPLRRSEKERQQNQSGAGAFDAIRNPGMASCAVSGSRGPGSPPGRCQAVEEPDRLLRNLIGAVGDGVRPPAGSVIARKNGTLGGRQTRPGARRCICRGSAFGGDHQDAICDIGKRRRIETARHAQHDTRQPLGMLCCQPRNVARDRGPEIRRAELQMVHQGGQAIGRRHIAFF